ncbi:MAG: preprotein translocase subunit SecE [Candidatus Dojkabacteria bacterium]|nr:preprotein translocase subunit SecE [Candidatus Dojkabacteria bacterium]MDQ7021769.1 preprotein translocase subunit SecE [Candidatus Dojkabacteria bacterium]
MNKFIDKILSIVDWFNPAENNFDNTWHFIAFGVKMILLIAIFAGIFLAIKNAKKLKKFISGTLLELRKVEWLDKKSLREYSIIVVIIITFTTLLILGFDQGFLSIRNILIK